MPGETDAKAADRKQGVNYISQQDSSQTQEWTPWNTSEDVTT